jgi:hypothetical protein
MGGLNSPSMTIEYNHKKVSYINMTTPAQQQCRVAETPLNPPLSSRLDITIPCTRFTPSQLRHSAGTGI